MRWLPCDGVGETLPLTCAALGTFRRPGHNARRMRLHRSIQHPREYTPFFAPVARVLLNSLRNESSYLSIYAPDCKPLPSSNETRSAHYTQLSPPSGG